MTIHDSSSVRPRPRVRLASMGLLARATFASALGQALGSVLVPALLLTQLTACSSTDKPKPAVVQPVLQRPGQKSVTVTADNTGSAVVLDTAQELIVDLEVPTTTNLEWSLVDLKPGVVSLTSAKFERALRNLTAEESGGSTVFRLKADAAGNVALKFDLRRARSLDPAVQSVTYSVTVK